MSPPAHLDSSKRRPSSGHITPPGDNATTRPLRGKQKLAHPARPPPAFWDDLSEIPLTRSALRELDRRNASTPPSSSLSPARALCPRPPRRPVTRRTAHEQMTARTPIQPATQFIRPSSQTELSQIKSFARQGGPDLSDLRAHHYEPAVVASGSEISSRHSSLGRRKRSSAVTPKNTPTPQMTSTKSTGPYDRAFQQHLIDHGIYHNGCGYPDGNTPPQPNNLDDILRILAKPRPSLSPSRFSDGDFGRFKRADGHASKECKCVSGQIPFTNLDHLTDGSLVAGNPDRYYGARPEQLNRQVRTKLSGYIVPSTQRDLPVAPNFFLTAKGPDGSLAVAKRQACYDGALGARGIRSLQTYGDTEPDHDNKAYTITSTYLGGQLKIYTSHPLPPPSPGASGGYVTTQINAWSMTGNAGTFRQGAAAYRNARDWARQVRDDAIKKANETLAQDEHSPSAPLDGPALGFASSQRTLTQFRLGTNTPSSFGDSDTSADELGLEVPSAKRTRRLSRRRPADTDPESTSRGGQQFGSV